MDGHGGGHHDGGNHSGGNHSGGNHSGGNHDGNHHDGSHHPDDAHQPGNAHQPGAIYNEGYMHYGNHNHSNHADIGFEYAHNFPGTYHVDELSGAAYFQDAFFHSLSFNFLNAYAYMYGDPVAGWYAIDNNSYLLGLLLTSNYSHSGFGLYPFGNLLYSMAAQLLINQNTSHAGSGSAAHPAQTDAAGVQENPQYNTSNRYCIGAHVAHGFLDVHAAFKSLAEQDKLLRTITRHVVQIEPVLSDKAISDWDRFVPPYTREVTPKGYYPGATGLTYFTQQSWTTSLSANHGSEINVRIVTWYFDRVDDYETRLDIEVTPGENFLANRIAASKLSQTFLKILERKKPSSFAQAKRCRIFKGDYLIW